MPKRLTALLLACVLLFSHSAAESLSFTEGEPHASQLDFRLYFKTMTAHAGSCTISIQQTIFDPDQAAQLYSQITADESALTALLPAQQHTVYIVDKLPAGLQCIGSAVYCTAETVLDGSYRPWLAEAAYGTQRWQSIGLAGLAFGSEPDAAALAAWYADDAHDDMLSLFPAYFVQEFASADELAMAEASAVSLAEYIAEQDGAAALLTAHVSNYVPGWLASLGIERVHTDPYAGLLDGYTYGRNQFYALIATSPKGDVFKMNPLSRDMHTPAQVRRTLCDLELAVDAMLDGVEQDAPEFYPILLRNYEAPITYEFADSSYSLTYHDNRRITIGAATSIVHETAHMIAPCAVDRISRYMDTWKVEALAEYLTLTYHPSAAERATAFSALLNGLPASADAPAAPSFEAALREIYLQYASMPATPQEVNMKLWYRADLLAARQHGIEVYTVSGTYAGAGSASLELMNGNELSYIEAEWFASYLIDQYGLDTFMHYCMDEGGVAFEEAFGMSYTDVKEQWLSARTMLD